MRETDDASDRDRPDRALSSGPNSPSDPKYADGPHAVREELGLNRFGGAANSALASDTEADAGDHGHERDVERLFA